jgi:hypothetical protein
MPKEWTTSIGQLLFMVVSIGFAGVFFLNKAQISPPPDARSYEMAISPGV